MVTRVKKELPDADQSQAVRKRQCVAASVLNKHFGPFRKSHPDLWAHRTFLLIVGKIYEHLVLNAEISPKEFVDLTKSFAESCKTDLQGKTNEECKEKGDVPAPDLGGVMDGLQAVVQQIYGTNLQEGEANPQPPSAAITKAS